MDGYCRRMGHLTEYCEFQDNDREIHSQIIQGCESARLRRRALREPDMTLKTLLDTASAMYIAQLQAAGMENNSESVNFVKLKQTSEKGRSKFQSQNVFIVEESGRTRNDHALQRGKNADIVTR